MGVAPRACIRGVFNAVIWSVATVVVLPIGMVCGAWASCCGAGEELCGCGCVTRADCAEHTHTWRTDETKSFPEGCGFAPRMRVQHRPVVQMKQMRHDSGRRPRRRVEILTTRCASVSFELPPACTPFTPRKLQKKAISTVRHGRTAAVDDSDADRDRGPCHAARHLGCQLGLDVMMRSPHTHRKVLARGGTKAAPPGGGGAPWGSAGAGGAGRGSGRRSRSRSSSSSSSPRPPPPPRRGSPGGGGRREGTG